MGGTCGSSFRLRRTDCISSMSHTGEYRHLSLTGLSHDPGVPAVLVKVVSNALPQASEDLGASGKVETSELGVLDALSDDLGGRSWNKLNHGRWDTGLEEDLVNDVVGVRGHRGWLPHDDITNDSWGKDQVSTDGSLSDGPSAQFRLQFLVYLQS